MDIHFSNIIFFKKISYAIFTVLLLFNSCSGGQENAPPQSPNIASGLEAGACLEGNKCNEGLICNAQTNKCDKKTADICVETECPSGYKCDAETNSCYDYLATQVIKFKEENLKKAIAVRLGKNEADEITQRDCWDLTELKYANLYGSGSSYMVCTADKEELSKMISSLDGIEFCPNIEKIDLRCNKLNNDSLAPLSNLNKLTSLDLQYNVITDISHLAKLTKLEELNLVGNLITDISILGNFINLKGLTLDARYVLSLTPLSKLAKLTSLTIATKNQDITFLSKLTNLTSLILGDGTLMDISPLKNLTLLQSLRININDNFSDISVLSNLTKLTSLILYGHKIVDITPLSDLTELTYLSLGNNKIENISAISNMTKLNTLQVTGNNIADLSPIVDLLNKGAFKPDGLVMCMHNNPVTAANTLVRETLKAAGIKVDGQSQ